MKIITIKCDFCEDPFEREEGKVKKAISNNKKQFCSNSCFMCFRHKHHLINPKLWAKGRPNDEFSQFRKFLSCIKSNLNRRKHPCSVTLIDLKEQWDKQNGICPYTGWKLISATETERKTIGRIPNRASLDRIDSSKGYEPGNIQFISLIAQYAKNSYTEQQLIDFCKAVAENNK